MRQSLAFVLLLLALPAVAQIYKYTDANGNTAYSNQPPNGTKAEPVDLPPLNSVDTVAPPPAPPSASQNQSQTQQNTAAYQVLELTDLPQGEALRANNGTFTVGVAIQPRLQAGHLLQLIVDGTPYGQPTNVPRLQAVDLDRGEHSLAVQVLQGAQSIQQSQTTTLTVQRVHVGKP
ncbi:DUF4124 domain-containing protein [Pseudomonas sp. Bc-h]|jgi:hypothetical protein|uniref:DUF4124 domain-containing protein n=1 Tax=Pseudomonas sp. Bc-h TaxID=1943632 RepID=UPI0009DB6231|nr:DUF4124 domain-containing protein [Pseudomonas sp. Bc-h]OQR34038.1 DUF4124 domain-containing protein [Pseudomonas sp. Bc-h]